MTPQDFNILLIGMRGCGKTTVGSALAAMLKRPFVDLDQRTLANFATSSVSEVWKKHGEAAWREAEARSLIDVLEAHGQVIALGGGTPMVEPARQRIQADRSRGAAKVVYLTCSTGELRRRLARMPGVRPSLTGKDPSDEVEAVLASREATYREIADFTLDVTSLSPDDAATHAAKMIRSGRSRSR